MTAAAARNTARQQLEATRRARLAERLTHGETISDGEARAAGFRTAAAATRALSV